MALRTPGVTQNARSTLPASSSSVGQTSTTPAHQMPPELERTLSLLSSHRTVLGYLLVTRGLHPSIIRHTGAIFEGDQGRRYAAVIARIVESVQNGLEEIKGDDTPSALIGTESDSDDLRFMRIRTRKHELMISPDDRYVLAVLHDPAS